MFDIKIRCSLVCIRNIFILKLQFISKPIYARQTVITTIMIYGLFPNSLNKYESYTLLNYEN